MSPMTNRRSHSNLSPDKETALMDVRFMSRRASRRKLIGALTVCVALLAGALGATAAHAAYGLNNFDVTFTNQDGTMATQAGSHPFAMTTSFGVNYSEATLIPDGDPRDLIAQQIKGFIGNPTATPKCKTIDFISRVEGEASQVECPDDTAIGAIWSAVNRPENKQVSAVYNLQTAPGVAARIGFMVLGVSIVVDVGVKQGGDYNITGSLINTPQPLNIFGSSLQLWGDPSDPAHDPYRGACLRNGFSENGEFVSRGECHVNLPRKPFLTLPTNCAEPLASSYESNSWQEPAGWTNGSVLIHDESQPPNPQAFTGCGKLGFSPRVESKATTVQAETGTGLDFNVDFHNEGLTNSEGLAESEIGKAQITLPQGVTVNPSIGEGLGVCAPADLRRETLSAGPGEGCPNASKIGTLHVDTPLVEEGIDGLVYLAQQDDPTTTEPGAENPFDSLIALYLVLKNPNLGVLVKMPLKVEPDPTTGQLVSTLENVPQLPFSHFNFHFREGQRAPLVTPSHCGTYTTEAKFWPSSDPGDPRTVLSSFDVTKGVGGGPCPPGGVPPFHPKFEAGALNNNAASFSPFDMRLIREDGEQDMTKFSSILPPGELGSLAGVAKCPDSAIAAARGKTGRQELASPSCPPNSLIGHTLAGAGVGGALTYVGGQIYLGGPYHGDPLSVIAITPAVAGPFDAGTVVVQLALTLNPKTAEVEVDGANSDPIPHILKGIVLKLRDLRVYVDRPNFTLNPTSCDESKTKATLFGSNLEVFNPADDDPVDLSTRYQAANCLNLGFKPRLALKLKGGTRRGGHPALKAIYTPKKGDANIKGLVVRLPRSAFLDQAHIKTICTRVQFAAGAGNGAQCPAASRYGFVKAWTPLLDEPLEGPVFLRSSNHKLPDLLFALHGLVNIEVDVRIDSSHGGIRATLEDAPDATLSKVVLRMQGAKKGLIINSKNICAGKNRANVLATGHNGKQFHTHPVMRAQCGHKRKRAHKRHRHP
jgi:hypothetical protein